MGDTHPPTLISFGSLALAKCAGPLGEDLAHHGPRCALRVTPFA